MPGKAVKLMSLYEISVFFMGLGALLQAGVPLNESMVLLAEDLADSRPGHAAEKIDAGFEKEYFTLGRGMQRAGGFPPYAVRMVELGETAGTLDVLAVYLGEYYQRQEALRQSLKKAFSAPLFLAGTMGAVLAFFCFVLLPVFERIFSLLGGGIMSGAFVAARLAVAVVVLLFVVFLVLTLAVSRRGGMRLLLKSGPARRLAEEIALSRLTQALAMLLNSGISPALALEHAAKLVYDDAPLTEKITACAARLEEGTPVAAALVQTGVLRGLEAKVLLAAARAGSEGQALERISRTYADAADSRIDRMLGIIEPLLACVLCLAVGGVLVAVLLPLVALGGV